MSGFLRLPDSLGQQKGQLTAPDAFIVHPSKPQKKESSLPPWSCQTKRQAPQIPGDKQWEKKFLVTAGACEQVGREAELPSRSRSSLRRKGGGAAHQPVAQVAGAQQADRRRPAGALEPVTGQRRCPSVSGRVHLAPRPQLTVHPASLAALTHVGARGQPGPALSTSDSSSPA